MLLPWLSRTTRENPVGLIESLVSLDGQHWVVPSIDMWWNSDGVA
jgi:hypothetical protein